MVRDEWVRSRYEPRDVRAEYSSRGFRGRSRGWRRRGRWRPYRERRPSRDDEYHFSRNSDYPDATMDDVAGENDNFQHGDHDEYAPPPPALHSPPQDRPHMLEPQPQEPAIKVPVEDRISPKHEPIEANANHASRADAIFDSDATDEDLTVKAAEKLGIQLPPTELESELLNIYSQLASAKLQFLRPSVQPIPALPPPSDALIDAIQKRKRANHAKLEASRAKFGVMQRRWLEKCSQLDDLQPPKSSAPTNFAQVAIPESPRSRGRRSRNTGDAARSEAEFMQILANLELETARDPLIRSRLTSVAAPDQIVDPMARQCKFYNTNNQVTDLDSLRARLADDHVDNFSELEHQAFCDAYVQWPKQFGRISAAMGGFRSFHECVMHYYRTKAEVNYKLLLQKRRSKGRRGRKPKKKAEAAVAVEAAVSSGTLGPALVPTKSEEGGESTDAEMTPQVEDEPQVDPAPQIPVAVATAAVVPSVQAPVQIPVPSPEEAPSVSEVPAAPEAPAPAESEPAVKLPEPVAEPVPEHVSKPSKEEPKSSEPVSTAATEPQVPHEPITPTDAPQSSSPVHAPPRAQPAQPAQPVKAEAAATAPVAPSRVLPPIAARPTPMPVRSTPAAGSGHEIPPAVQPLSINRTSDAMPKFGIDALATVALETERKEEDEKKGRKPRRTRRDPKPTSYWNAAETKKFETLIGVFGSKWDDIARHMEFKSAIMLKNYYTKYGSSRGYESIVDAADARIASSGVMPVFVSAEVEDEEHAAAAGVPANLPEVPAASRQPQQPTHQLQPQPQSPASQPKSPRLAQGSLPPTGFFDPRPTPRPVRSFTPAIDENAPVLPQPAMFSVYDKPPRPSVRPRTSLLASILHDGAELPMPRSSFIEADSYMGSVLPFMAGHTYRESNERGHD